MSLCHYVNHFSATLATSIGASDTVLILDLSSSVPLASVPSDSFIPLTLLDSANPTAFEVVYCTSVSGTQFVVRRAMEGSAAQSWSAGVSVISPPTAGMHQLYTQAGFTPVWSAAIAAQIGGYQTGARVEDSSGVLWRSTADDNLSEPGSANASWVQAYQAASSNFVGQLTDALTLTEPAGWLLCDGRPVSRTTYAALFSVIGTICGSGDGSTTFNIPDLRGRTLFGADNMGGSSAGRVTTDSGFDGTKIAYTGGSQYMMAHNHGVNDSGHSHGVNDPGHNHDFIDTGHSHSVNDPTHNHVVSDPGHAHSLTQKPAVRTDLGLLIDATSPPPLVSDIFNSSTQPVTAGNATTGISIQGAATGVTVNPNGTGAHNNPNGTSISIQSSTTGISTAGNGIGNAQNMPPAMLVAKFIYCGV